jgi:hypothetical protein
LISLLKGLVCQMPRQSEGPASVEFPFDKSEQVAKVTEMLRPNEQILAVYDCVGAGTGFLALTTSRVVLQDNSFLGKKIAVTSIPYSRVTSVSMVSNKSSLGSFFHSGEVAISTSGGQVYSAEFRGDGKSKRVHDVVLHYLLT